MLLSTWERPRNAGKGGYDAAYSSQFWPDGQAFGKVRLPAFLQPEYADSLYTGVKKMEGRWYGTTFEHAAPGTPWLK